MRLLILALIALVVYAVYKTVQAYRYRRRLSAADPLLIVSRKERRAWAREQLKREQDAYNHEFTERMLKNMKWNVSL